MKLAVVIPTYNEKVNLPLITSQLMNLPLPGLQLLIIDDNIPDGTGKVADNLITQYPGRIQVLHRTGKLGLGTAYVTGFKMLLKTDVDAIAQMDADFSHPPEKLITMVQALTQADMIIGSRYAAGGSLDDDWPKWRKWLSRFGNEYSRVILGASIKDMTAGYRLWKRLVLEAIPLDHIRSNGYIFQVEMAYVASRLGFHIMEIPIHFAERKFGQSKMNLRIQLEAALRVWQLRRRYRALKPAK
jgi:dolichol-phosphate mannosyltransferase